MLNPRRTASRATSLRLRAKADGIDAQTIARGLVAGYGRASTLPDETVQALRELTRARRDLIRSRTAARQRLLDELVVVFPELADHTPDGCDLATPAVLQLLGRFGSARALADAPMAEVAAALREHSASRRGGADADAPRALARRSAAGGRAVARHLLDLRRRVAELDAAIAQALDDDQDGQRLQGVPGIGPVQAATIRAELGDVARFASVDQVVASAGLDPRTCQSGAFAGQKKLSKRGPGALRRALYLASVVAARYRPEWRERYHRLLARGRAKKEALTILSRASLKVIYHLLRADAASDPAFLKPRAGAGLDSRI